MKTAFVTGSTGLLGSNLVRELVSRGVIVRALARDSARARRLIGDHASVEIVEGDMEDVAGFAAQLASSDVLFHAAAYFRDSYSGGSHWPSLERVNVQGTRALIDAAYRQGIRRVLHVSSIGTLETAAPDGRAVGADRRLEPHQTDNDYFRSKILADRVVEEALSRHADLWGAFVLPGFMNGPGDAGPTAAGQTILDFAAGRLPGVVNAHLSYVDARDVAWACVESALHAPRGARYVVAGRRLHLGDAYTILERLTGVAAPRRRIPMPLLAAVATANEVWARLSGRPVLIGLATYRNLRDQGPHNRYDSTPAEQALGVRFRPVEETLADAIAWLRETGRLEEAASESAPSGTDSPPVTPFPASAPSRTCLRRDGAAHR